MSGEKAPRAASTHLEAHGKAGRETAAERKADRQNLPQSIGQGASIVTLPYGFGARANGIPVDRKESFVNKKLNQEKSQPQQDRKDLGELLGCVADNGTGHAPESQGCRRAHERLCEVVHPSICSSAAVGARSLAIMLSRMVRRVNRTRVV